MDGSITIHEHPVSIFTICFELHRGTGGGCLFLTRDEGEAMVDELLAAGSDLALREVAVRYLQTDFGPVDAIAEHH